MKRKACELSVMRKVERVLVASTLVVACISLVGCSLLGYGAGYGIRNPWNPKAPKAQTEKSCQTWECGTVTLADPAGRRIVREEVSRALCDAFGKAAEACAWEQVGQLARELEARRKGRRLAARLQRKYKLAAHARAGRCS